jgi:arsenate reductase
MSKPSILHNPRCSKSRQTLALLQEHNVDVEVVEYLKTPLQSAELESIKSKLGISSFIEMMRTKEAEFKEAQLSKVDSSESDFLSAMVEYPKLIERPIVMTEDSAAIGRPPEAVLGLFK